MKEKTSKNDCPSIPDIFLLDKIVELVLKKHQEKHFRKYTNRLEVKV